MTATLKQFTTSDDYQLFEAYHEDTEESNDWEVAFFTREQAESYLEGYKLEFEADHLVWHMSDDETETIMEEAIVTDKNEILTVYAIPGEFMLAEDLECDECDEPADMVATINRGNTRPEIPLCTSCAHDLRKKIITQTTIKR